MVSWVGIKTKREVQLYKLLKWIHCQSFGERWFPPDLRIGELLNVHFFSPQEVWLIVLHPLCQASCLWESAIVLQVPSSSQTTIAVSRYSAPSGLTTAIFTHFHSYTLSHLCDMVLILKSRSRREKTIRLSTWYLKWIVYGWLLHVVWY